MKCLQIVPSYKPAFVYGGPIYSCSALCEELIKQGHEVTVITTTANGKNELDVKPGVINIVDGVSVIYFKRYTKDHSHLSPGLFKYLWKNNQKFDSIHIHSWWNIISLTAVVICAIKGARPVVSPRGMLSDYTRRANHAFSKRFIHQVIGRPFLSKVKFHATSAAEYEEIIKLYPSAFVSTIFNLVKLPDIGNYEHLVNKRKNKVNMLFLSRIDPKKGLELLFAALKDISWDYHLTIAGPYDDDYKNKLAHITKEAGIDNKVTWLGGVYGDKKYDLLASSDFLVLPSYNENFAVVVIESLAVGCPVLISENVGLSPYITRKNLGWVTKTTVETLITALNELNADTKKQDWIRTNSPKIIRNDFDAEKIIKAYISLYQIK